MFTEPFLSLAVEGEVTIYRAPELKAEWMTALQRTALLELNLGGVTELDTAGVQVLMTLKQVAQTTSRELRLVAHSPAVLEIFELLDLGGWFGDPLLIAA